MTDFRIPGEPEPKRDPKQAKTNGHAPVRDLTTVWADDITLVLDAGGVVDGLLPRTGLSVLYGESGSGKTFNAIDLTCCVACGLPWRGKEVEQGVVIYVAAEAPASVERRLWAWKRRHGVEHLPVLVVQSSVDLLNGDADALVALVARVARDHGRVAMVLFDTLSRSMTGNENHPDDMGRYVAACSRIREAGNTHVLIVHHSGKDTAKGARGHSSLRAASDVELEVADGAIRVTKSRDEAGGGVFGFRLDTVELGTNAKNRLVGTCVAVEADAPVKAAKGPPLTPKQKTVLDCLAAALVDHGEEAPLTPDIPRKARVARFARWQEAALRYLPNGDGAEWRKREDFKRTVEALQAKGLIRHVQGWCWLAGSPSQTSQTSQCDDLRGSARPRTTPSQTSQHPIGVRGCEVARVAPLGGREEKSELDEAVRQILAGERTPKGPEEWCALGERFAWSEIERALWGGEVIVLKRPWKDVLGEIMDRQIARTAGIKVPQP